MFRKLCFLLCASLFASTPVWAQQDTVVVQTFTFDNDSRNQEFTFPTDNPNSYEKILMQYRMRCHDAQVNTTGGNGIACGEWDYSCNTYITDSTRLDSTLATHPNYLVSNFTGNQFDYNNEMSYDLRERNHVQTTVTNKISETLHAINNGQAAMNMLSPNSATHTQWLYTASQLSSAGLSAGDIVGLNFSSNAANGTLKNLRISVKHSSASTIDPTNPDFDGFSNLVYTNYNLSSGTNFIPFSAAFNWNGSDNLLIDVSFEAGAGTDLILEGGATANTQAIIANSGGYMDFNGGGYLDINNADFSSIDQEITVGFWMFGDPDFLGENNSTIFEGTDANNQRQVNAHLPWSNNNVYWDCGNDGSGYDRINKLAPPTSFEGAWNHWTFVKNASTGSMAMFRNGSQYHSGSGMTKAIDLVNFVIGAGANGNPVYQGLIDDFRIYNKAFTSQQVQALMKSDESVLSGLASNEFLNLNVVNGSFVDASSNANTVNTTGLVSIKKAFGHKLERGFASMGLPNLTFIAGDYDISNQDITSLDTLPYSAHQITEYQIVDNEPVAINSWLGWDEYETWVYDEDDNIININYLDLNETLLIEDLEYFRHYPSKIEIMSFVTPYGINLDLGVEGKMWEFDVTDFGPILMGDKWISLERGGQNQEEMDIRFLFIKGTPERDVKSFQQIWKVNSVNYQNIMADNQFQPVGVRIPTDAKYGRIRTMITGHGQEGEFIPRNHWVDINNGAKRFTWQAWTECGDNPIFPQGGTWVFDRAGWCPGAPTDLKLWDVSEYLTPGGALTVDYGIATASGDSRYIVNHQLVTYGEYNHAKDAAIVYVIQPSKRTEFDRFNTSCVTPRIRVRNRGSEVISNLKISYWVNPNNKLSFDWSGSINPSAEANIDLPVSDVAFWDGSTVFYAEIQQVNGAADEYSANNLYASPFQAVKTYEEPLKFIYRTNRRGSENSYKIYDIEGNVVMQKSGFANERLYSDDLNLNPGCYRIEWLDTGDDGLDFWYWAATGQSRGTGYLRLEKQSGGVLEDFEPDYGSNVIYDFVYNGPTSIDEAEQATSVVLFPNPSSDGQFTLYHKDELAQGDQILILDLTGKQVWQQEIQATDRNQSVDLASLNGGVYLCRIVRGQQVLATRKLSIVR